MLSGFACADDRFDLVIRGGEVIDPSQALRARRDIGIRWGRVAAVEASIPADRSAQSIDASGKLVLPGLIDLHAHVYPQASALGLPADELVPYTATTTYVSAGDAGANNFSAFKHYIIAQSRSRIFAFVHISSIGLAGFPVGEELNARLLGCGSGRQDGGRERGRRDRCEGAHLQERGGRQWTGTSEASRWRRQSARAAGARVMCHIGDAPGDLAQLLELLRPGDILTHTYSGAGNNTVQDGKVLPAALEAKKRGVIIDVGHGGGSFDYTVAEPAIAQGLVPDTISSDIHAVSGNTPGMPYLPWVMSKFLNLGFSLDDVVAMTTINPARVIGRVEKLGTLQVGAPADVSILELVEAPVTFVDTRKNTRQGNRWLKPVQTVRAGRPFGRPYPIPFAYP